MTYYLVKVARFWHVNVTIYNGQNTLMPGNGTLLKEIIWLKYIFCLLNVIVILAQQFS